MSASPDSLVASLERCNDASAASRDVVALVAHITQDEEAEAWLCEAAHARRVLSALSRVLVDLGAQLDAEALAAACTGICFVLEAALDDADDAVAVLQTASLGVCAACRCGAEKALGQTASAVALLASVGTPATRDALRAEAAPHLVAAMLRGCLDSAACVALHYLTQDGAAPAIARLPDVDAALGAALAAAAEDEQGEESARAAAAALAHVAADAKCAALLAPAAAGAVAALEAHAADAACVRWLAAAVAKLADAGAADARSPQARAAVAHALTLHRVVPPLRTLLLAALVAAAAAEEQAVELLLCSGTECSAPFSLETRQSGIAGAGAGLFVASGTVPAGALVALYAGEVWAEAPPDSVASGNEYLAASPGGGFADGSPAALARAAEAAAARGAPDLGARAAAHMANHPAAGSAPNCFFLELALPPDALIHAPAASPDGGAPPWTLCLLAAEALPCGAEVTVDYRIDADRAPPWFAPVAEHLALL